MTRVLFWAFAGMLVVPLDTLHVVTGVLSYPAPTAWMPLGLQAAWVIPLYACAGLALGLGHRHVATPLAARLRGGAVPPASLAAALAGLGALVVAYASSGALQTWPAVALVLYVAIFAVVVARVHADARPALVLHALGAAAVGPVIEMTLSASGAFAYAHPDVGGVALWLPGIYLNAGAASHLLDRHLLARSAGPR